MLTRATVMTSLFRRLANRHLGALHLRHVQGDLVLKLVQRVQHYRRGHREAFAARIPHAADAGDHCRPVAMCLQITKPRLRPAENLREDAGGLLERGTEQPTGDLSAQ